MTLTLRKATRRSVKIKVALQGPAGAGKTKSALRLAYGITNDYSKIAVIDTENRSSELYSDMGEFQVISLEAPFSPERYIQAIDLILAQAPEVEVIVIDSSSPEWSGKGGILEISNSMTGNSFTNWSKITPRHQAFMDKMLNTDKHFISTVRTKQDYVLVEKNGKQVPEKVGLAAVQREGMDYEYSLVFDIDIKHKATASKDRTGLFMDQPEFTITEETGEKLLKWANTGVDEIQQGIAALNAAQTHDDVKAAYNKAYTSNPAYKAALDAAVARVKEPATDPA
jgi:hypothetical protein